MKKIAFLLSLSIILISCGSNKTTTSKEIIVNSGKPNRVKTVVRKKEKDRIVRTTIETDEVITEDSNENKLDKIIDFAKTFEGTPYRYGGTNKNGMDCSGLVFTAFGNEDVQLPRISRDMATKGIEVPKKDAIEGDLIFFTTSRRKSSINHVGIITKVKGNEIKFIHSSTSSGVIISSLDENYWKNAFVKIRRII